MMFKLDNLLKHKNYHKTMVGNTRVKVGSLYFKHAHNKHGSNWLGKMCNMVICQILELCKLTKQLFWWSCDWLPWLIKNKLLMTETNCNMCNLVILINLRSSIWCFKHIKVPKVWQSMYHRNIKTFEVHWSPSFRHLKHYNEPKKQNKTIFPIAKRHIGVLNPISKKKNLCPFATIVGSHPQLITSSN